MGWSPWQDGYDNVVAVQPAANIGNGAFVIQDGSIGTSPAADLAAQIVTILAGSGTWRDVLVFGGFSFVAHYDGVRPDHALVEAFYNYEGITLLGSVAETNIPTGFPDDIPDNAASIPSDLVNDATLYDFIQFESKANTFLGWNDFNTFSADVITSTDEYANPAFTPGGTGPSSFTPPSDMPTIVGISDPVTPIGPQSGTSSDGWPRFTGPRLLPSDVEVFTSFTTDARSTDRISAPYTEDGVSGLLGELLDIQNVAIPLSTQDRKDLTLFVMPGYFAGTPLPLTGDFGANDFGFEFDDISVGGHTDIEGAPQSFFSSSGFPARMHSPRWRYWIDDSVYVFGGHYAELPGAPQIQVKKSDGTWIPIIDGLAPPLI